jgi:lysozyme
MTFGIDIDEPAADWAGLAASGSTFAFVRATFGTRTTPEFTAAWAAIKRAGLLRGAYHVLHPDQDVTAQAVGFLKVVHLQRGDLPPALDVDSAGGRAAGPIVDAMREWFAVVEAELVARHGHPILPILRTSEGNWRALGEPDGFADYPLWIIDWSRFDGPRTPAHWRDHWIVHQYAGGHDRFNPVTLHARGPIVLRVKDWLLRAGFLTDATAIFDDSARRAVMKFQMTRGLVEDGIVGPRTFAELHWP